MNRIFVLSVVFAAVGCTTALVAQETVGDRFRIVLGDIDARCKRDKMGPYLDRSDPEYRSKVAITDCDILKLQPRDWRDEKMVMTKGQLFPIPERWLTTPEGRFAHSLKLPAPHDQPKQTYKSGMNSKEYFEALCREEAGTFVFRSVENVEVVFETRPRDEVRSESFFHLFAMEDPYGYVNGETKNRIWRFYLGADRYQALERSASADGPHVISLSGYDSKRGRPLQTIQRSSATAKYGFVWRGITRPHDRDYGIAGGELIVFDRETQEVLGFKRGYTASGIGNRGVSWEFAPVCPKFDFRGGRSKDFDFGLWFISSVLQPRGYEAYRRDISGQAGYGAGR